MVTDAPPDPTYWQGRGWSPDGGMWDAELWKPKRHEWGWSGSTWEDIAATIRGIRTLCAPPSLEVRLRWEAAAFRRLSEYHYRQAANPWLLDSMVKSRERDEGFRFASIAESLEGVLREHEAATSPAIPE